MFVSFFRLFFCLCLAFLTWSVALAVDIFVPSEPRKEVSWPFDGVFGVVDRVAVQRGYKVYRQVCASCHSMNRIAFRNLGSIGFSDGEIKAIAASYNVKDGPNDQGDMYERPGVVTDYFIPPFPNSKAAAVANNGVFPPDLSLMVKAREDGPDYIYSLLTGYSSSSPDSNGLYTNPYFKSGGKLSMIPPLSDGIVTFEDGAPSDAKSLACYVVNFLQWAAEPEMEVRKRTGVKVLVSVLIMLIFCILANIRVWSKLRRGDEGNK